METTIMKNGVKDEKPYASRVKEMVDVLGSYVRALTGGANEPERYQSFEEFYDELVSLINEQIDKKLTGRSRQESPL